MSNYPRTWHSGAKLARATLAAISFILALTAVGLFGCRQRPPAAPAPEPIVTVLHPQRGAMTLSIELPGDLVGFFEAALHAKVTGYLKSISVDKGDRVKTGQVLAVIEVPELKANLEHAEARLAIDKITYQRLNQVWQSDPRLVAREDVDAAYAKYRAAQANVNTLRTLVGYTRIIAPFDGTITGRFADPGALIRAGGGDIGVDESSALISPGATEGAGGHRTGGGPILTIARLNKLRVYVYVPGRWCRYIRDGTPATLTFDEVPGLVVRSSVTRYASALDLATRTMLTEIDIDNPGGVLYPRMYAHVKLDLVSHPEALRLPTSAISGEGKTANVLVVKNGRLATTQVTTGINDGTWVEITKGLTTKDLVVATFSTDLKEGEKVRYTIASASPSAAVSPAE
jgi:multidrug efflux pump subunit AcrA (membrane-fusion protein)